MKAIKTIWAGLAWLGLSLTGTAEAADKPEFAPAAAWVKAASPSTQASADSEAAVRFLLTDEQVNIAATSVEFYYKSVLKIQTPQGLSMAGQVSLAWHPETDVITIHQLDVTRDGKVIDLLADGQNFTVLRRENELELSALNGVLTAVYQPAGLQVGDVLTLAYTLKQADPNLAGITEVVAGQLMNLPVNEGKLRLRWSDDANIRWKTSKFLTGVQETRKDGAHELAVTLKDVELLTQPRLAPARFYASRSLELSNLKSWADISRRFAPWYSRAATLNAQSPLQTELTRIRSSTADPLAQAAAALRLVQDQVRYVYLGLNDGRLIPADADTTWIRRFGDCKAKTALLLALLHGLGIDAQPVLVSTVFGDGLDTHLPMVNWFDHVLVRATIKGKQYWLDGTRTGDRQLDAAAVPGYEWALPLTASGAELVKLEVLPLEQALVSNTIQLDATAGIYTAVPFRAETTMQKDIATRLQLNLANLSAANRDIALRQYWQKVDYWEDNFDKLDIKSVSSSFNDTTGVLKLKAEGTARMNWAGNQHLLESMRLAYSIDLKRIPGPNSDAPYLVAYPAYERTEQTILLPNKGIGFSVVGADIDRVVGGTHYRRTASIKDGVFVAEATSRSVAREFPASEAETTEKVMSEMAGDGLYVKLPTRYIKTEQDQLARLSDTPKDAEGFIERGNVQMDRSNFDAAIEDFNQAIKMDSRSANAYADRGLAYAWKKDVTAATSDLDAAIALQPRNAVAFRGRGLVASQKNDCAAAIAAFTTSLEIDPDNFMALVQRAFCSGRTGKFEDMLSDGQKLVTLYPGDLRSWELLLSAQLNSTNEERLATIRAMLAAQPDSVGAHYDAGLYYSRLSMKKEAIEQFTEALTREPETRTYVLRAKLYGKANPQERRADVDAALKLKPDDVVALHELASIQLEQGNYPEAAALIKRLLEKAPNDVGLAIELAIINLKSGEVTSALETIDAMLSKIKQPMLLNNLCWELAIANVALDRALAACNASLEIAPGSAATLDSRAMVQLRLGEFDKSVRDYDAALALRPGMPDSLYGRSLARRSAGDITGFEADRAAAIAIAPGVADVFADYGLKP